MQCLGDLVETELVRRRWPPQQRDEAVELRAHRLQTAQSWRELLYPARLRSLIEKLPDYHQHFGEVLTSGPDAASLTRLRSPLDSRHQGLQTQMQAQVGVAVAHAFRRSCEVQARRRDLSDRARISWTFRPEEYIIPSWPTIPDWVQNMLF